MGRIRVLPDNLINRIAAGEVVERPASVLKELVENSLDAGARSVEVHLRGGGKQRILVTDDGTGMDRDDALLALERHATSKLTSASELDSIKTLGFRGEALASIAAVSTLLLRTTTADGTGTEIRVQGGRIVSVKEVGLPRGTSIEVQRLFHNVPARRKFLRADATELSHATRLMTQCALGHPGVRFHLEHAGRRLIRTDPAPDLDERIAQIHGRTFLERLLAFRTEVPGLQVRGYAGRPAEALSRREGQYFFVNGRPVQDRVLAHAVTQAYGNTMPKGRFPAIFLFLDLDPALVDVNVHPRKNEVRFRGSSQVHDSVRDAIAGALSREAVVPRLSDLRPSGGSEALSGVRRAALTYLELNDSGPRDPAFRQARGASAVPYAAEPARPAERGLVDMEAEAGSGVVPLAQYLDAYIVAQDGEGLILVDQHAAHERILFERFLHEAEANQVQVQQLLFPVTIELSAADLVVLERETEEFRRLGFVLEPFGGNTIRVDGIPALAGEIEPERLIRELLGEAAEARSAASGVAELRLRLITTAACRAAVKVNDPLNRESMQRLLDDLFATKSPSTCPHGRPLLFRLPLAEIERAFCRR